MVSAVIVQVSHPYKSIDHTYVFKTFNLVENDIFLFLRMVLIFWKEAFAMAILFLISVLYLPSDVNVYPRYLNFCTCLICSPLLKSLHSGLFFFLDTTIHSVFFTFRDNPSFSLSSTTIFRSLCKSSSDPAIEKYHLHILGCSDFHHSLESFTFIQVS